ncbi:MAG TPA: LysR family transcriptional regulator [Methylophaga aminisulfidivorans]|jgi:molybdate transport system regulatory protein|uniref:winged helix-turn-helix domain-containing protein n=1 Tax=Methylophaga TaxID=40222 RepID=UPI00175441F9|nr:MULTISPECIES: LysR family transcriptional regulator [Methylophaga]HIC46994.1 LysR family transcriptional regulator [Methylophaga sp.]HIM40204.1 LysR family transcriptional regulator [Methylophaga aminisulfidivorans]
MSNTSIKIRLHHHDNIAFGPGKADLLDAIKQYGSISAAGRSMGMSYKRAWDLVQTMNQSFKQPIVTTSKGGSQKGGAVVTSMGEKVLNQYREAEKAADAATAEQLKMLSTFLAN